MLRVCNDTVGTLKENHGTTELRSPLRLQQRRVSADLWEQTSEFRLVRC